MKSKITIEQSEQQEIDMDTLLRCYEYIKSAEAEPEKPVISEGTILRIVIISVAVVLGIAIMIIGYFSGDGFIMLSTVFIAFLMVVMCILFS